MNLVNKPAPAFSMETVLPDGSFSKITNESFKGKYAVLFTYPLDFTFTCPTEILALDALTEQLAAMDVVVAAGSVDSVYSHLAWTKLPKQQGGLAGLKSLVLFSDLDRAFGQAYGCLLEDGHHSRATYIINPEGKVVHVSANSPGVGRNVDEVLRLVEAFKFVDANGVVCPANWKKGGKTIVPTPKDSLAFFESS